MADKMRVLPLDELLARMFEEYRRQRSLFDLHEDTWYHKRDARTLDVQGDRLETVLGPAAGPHTQLSQNIISAYLTGSRFIELKTVQVLDALEIDKPCIDMYDEGFNTEWSTELSLQKAWEEYARAWIALHMVEALWDFKRSDQDRSFVFNMSVGYDLAGIQTDKMQQYLDRMIDSSREPLFSQWLEEIERIPATLLAGSGLEARADRLQGIGSRIPGQICRSVTLSTMHGCPPDEIESICRYLLTEKGLDTYVKMNPTLLGYKTVRGMLDRLGYDYVQLNPAGFDHDIQYDDALGVLTRLREVAAENGRRFGVKLTNTLASVNNRDELPGEEMYMSGRALFPITINVAARLSEYFEGDLPISYSGGISMQNVVDVFSTGIRPITLCTNLLKPGGYARQVQMAKAIDEIAEWDRDGIDVKALTALAERSLTDETLHKKFRGADEVASEGALPAYDCYEAPCVSACAINQHIPEYIRLVGEERYDEALELIYERNALPAITGAICDHACQLVCTRLDYEGCLNIREIKKIAVERGMQGYTKRWKRPKQTRDARCVVVGSGPAGLSAAYFLAREGFPVTVLERDHNAGGVVENVVPHFRITREEIASDIDHIRANGVEFTFGVEERIDVESLRAAGYTYVVLAVGTYQPRLLTLEGENERVLPAYDFLRTFNLERDSLDVGKRVAVVGAGDTAMDCARAALRTPGVEHVEVIYRRAFEQMPASREEYEFAEEDGIPFSWLRNPERFDADGTLTLRVMELGEADQSGRRRPIATDKTETIRVDTIISAIGDDPSEDILSALPIARDSRGAPVTRTGGELEIENVFLAGDARTGASTIVQCIAEGRRAADAICKKEEAAWRRIEHVPGPAIEKRIPELNVRKMNIVSKPNARSYNNAKTFAWTEHERCLECNYVCNKCVDVCPNRSNIAIPVVGEPLFSDPFQIVHLDAYCNECGNCGHFCPWEGRPYIDKPTVFSSEEDFANSENEGWLVIDGHVRVRFGDRTFERPLENGSIAGGDWTTAGSGDEESSERFARLFQILYETRPHLFGATEPMV